MKMVREFKEFAIKGNMFDMAIGIIIGVAFNKIINSLVNDIILPFFSYLIGDVNFQNLKVNLQKEIIGGEGVIIQEGISINYGNFLQVIFEFLIIAFTIFMVIKIFNRLRRKAEDENNPTVVTPKEVELLAEIRDLLKENRPFRGGN